MTKLRSVGACKRDPSTFEGWEEEEDPTKAGPERGGSGERKFVTNRILQE